MAKEPEDKGLSASRLTHRPVRVWKGMARAVYVAQREDGLVKIGISKTPQNRVALLAARERMVIELRHTIDRPDGDALLVESIAHEQLTDREREREWFDVPVVAAVEAVQEAVRRVEAGERSLEAGERHPGAIGWANSKTVAVGIVCTSPDKIAYRAAARAAGQTLSAWLKKLADDALRAAKRKRP